MKPLFVLCSLFALSLAATRIFAGTFNLPFSGKIALSGMLVFTGIAHFIFTRGMSMMLPQFIPFKKQIIYFTGAVEFIAAIAIFIPVINTLTGWLLITFFLSVLPANLYAAANNVDHQKATFNGSGLSYLWFRLPLQLLLIAWTYYFVVR